MLCAVCQPRLLDRCNRSVRDPISIVVRHPILSENQREDNNGKETCKLKIKSGLLEP